VQRQVQRRGCRVRRRHRDGQRRVGAEPALRGCAVELDQAPVDTCLVARRKTAQGAGDLAVDVGHGTGDVESAE
jgi:hypothetical protein